jgi:hypothetical protein
MRRTAGVALAMAAMGLVASCEDRRVPRVDPANRGQVQERTPASPAEGPGAAGGSPATEGGRK